MPHVITLRPIHEDAIAHLRATPGVTVETVLDVSDASLAAKLPTADVLIHEPKRPQILPLSGWRSRSIRAWQLSIYTRDIPHTGLKRPVWASAGETEYGQRRHRQRAHAYREERKRDRFS